jgi:hypothetical protein
MAPCCQIPEKMLTLGAVPGAGALGSVFLRTHI